MKVRGPVRNNRVSLCRQSRPPRLSFEKRNEKGEAYRSEYLRSQPLLAPDPTHHLVIEERTRIAGGAGQLAVRLQ